MFQFRVQHRSKYMRICLFRMKYMKKKKFGVGYLTELQQQRRL
jgi:hypothetical protein